jgi:hypothetical protein
MLVLYPATLMKVFIRSEIFWWSLLGSFKYRIISSVISRDNLTTSFPICIPFISLLSYCSSKNSGPILIKSVETHNLVSFLILEEMLSIFLHSVMLAIGLSYMAFIMMKYEVSILIFFRDFYHEEILNFVRIFLHLLRPSCDFCAWLCCVLYSVFLICICWTILASLVWNQLDHVLLNSVFKCFVEGSFVCVHQGN